MQVRLGNPQPVSVLRGEDGSETRTAIDPPDGDEHAVTEVVFPDDVTLAEAFRNVTDPSGVWAYHSDGPPAWVSSDSKGLAALLSEHFGCDVRRFDAKVLTVHADPSAASVRAHKKAVAELAAKVTGRADDDEESSQ